MPDDNTVSHSLDDVDKLVCQLEIELRTILKWLKPNCLGANPDKLQCIAQGQDATKHQMSVEGWTILPSIEVKDRRITLDKDVEFYKHVSDICCNAARQINVLTKYTSGIRSRNSYCNLHEELYYL